MERRNITNAQSPGAGLTINTNLSNYSNYNSVLSDLIDPTDVIRSRTTTTDHRKTDHDRTSYFYTFPSIVSPTGSRLKPLLLVERVYGSSYPVPPKRIDAGEKDLSDGSDKRDSIMCQSLPTPPETPPVSITDDSTLVTNCTTNHTSTINSSPFSSFSSISSISTSNSFSASSSASTPTFSSAASTSSASTTASRSTSASTCSLPRYVRTPISPPPARSLSLSLPLPPDSTTNFDGSARACNTLQFHLPFRPIRRVTGPEHTITHSGDINTSANDNTNDNTNVNASNGNGNGTHSRSISAEDPIQSTSAIPLMGLGPRHRPSFSLSHWGSGFRPRPSLIAALESIGSKFVSYTQSATTSTSTSTSTSTPTSPTTTTSTMPTLAPVPTPVPTSVEALVAAPVAAPVPSPVAIPVQVQVPVQVPAPTVVNTTLFDADFETASLSSHKALPATSTAPTAPITSSVSTASIASIASTTATVPTAPTVALVPAPAPATAPISSRPVLSKLQVPVNTRIRSGTPHPSFSPIATPTPTSTQTYSPSPSPSSSPAPSPLLMATPTRPLALARPRARSPLLLAPVIEAARLSGTSRDFVRPDVPTSPLSPISPDSPVSPLTLTRGRGRLYVTNPDPPSICIEVTPAEEHEDADTVVDSGSRVDEFEIKVDPSPFNSTSSTNSTDSAVTKADFKANFYANPNRHIDVDHLSVSRILERHGSSASLFSITAVTVTDGEGAQDVEDAEDAEGAEDEEDGDNENENAYSGIDEVEMVNPTNSSPLASPIRRPSASSTGSSTVLAEDEYEGAKKEYEDDEDEEKDDGDGAEEEEDIFGWEIMTPRKRRPSTLRKRFSGILRCF